MVQDTNKSLQEYNGSLQQYNSNLQADATMNGEIISKLQREKSAMMEAMTNLKDLNNSIKNQLDSSMVSFVSDWTQNRMLFHMYFTFYLYSFRFPRKKQLEWKKNLEKK